MAITNADKQLEDALEALVDHADVDRVIQALAQVCWAKSSHIEENWQDRVLAKYWSSLGHELNKLKL